MNEKKISSKKVYGGKFLTVFFDEVEVSDPTSDKKIQSTREYIKHPGAACIIPLHADGTVTMIEQFRYPSNKVFIEFPAGKRDDDEDFATTASRELTEEVGLIAGNIEYLTEISPCIGYSDEIIKIYLATELTETSQRPDFDEILKPFRISLDELEQKIWNHEIPDVKTQLAAMWLLRNRRKFLQP